MAMKQLKRKQWADFFATGEEGSNSVDVMSFEKRFQLK